MVARSVMSPNVVAALTPSIAKIIRSLASCTIIRDMNIYYSIKCPHECAPRLID